MKLFKWILYDFKLKSKLLLEPEYFLPEELLLSLPHWIRIASTSSLVQLEVLTPTIPMLGVDGAMVLLTTIVSSLVMKTPSPCFGAGD